MLLNAFVRFLKIWLKINYLLPLPKNELQFLTF
jgi:hypothetical protein